MCSTLNTSVLNERLKNLLETESMESDAIQDIVEAQDRLSTADTDEAKQQAMEDIQCAEHVLESTNLSLEDNIELDELSVMEAVVPDFREGTDLILDSEFYFVNQEGFGKVSHKGKTYLYKLKQST